MNEPIAKLAAKAGFDVGIHDGMVLGNLSDMHKCQKLVELTIKEVVRLMCGEDYSHTADPIFEAMCDIQIYFEIKND